MTRIFAILLAFLAAFTATPAHAGPFAALIPVVIGAVVKSAVVKLALTLAASVALSALSKQKKSRSPGIMIEQTLTGGTNPRTAVFGLYCTAGSLAAPAYSYGKSGKTPNANLVKIISLADIPIHALSRIIVNGEYVPMIGGGPVSGGQTRQLGGKYLGKGSVTFYDGRQTVADPALVAALTSFPNRPWTASRVGTGVAYAIFNFVFDAEVHKGEPDIKVEVMGLRLYDPRKDSTVGGAGSHRWGQPETYEFTVNPPVMVYNTLRGIPLPGGGVFGGECEADEVPLANWVAAMNVADETVITLEGSEPRYRAGYEFSLDDEAADVIEELMKASAMQIVENGGVYKVRVGPPSLPVMFITDEDFIVTKEQELDPFPGINIAKNTVRAVFPHPEEIWQQHDAPMFQPAEFLAADNGTELVADIQFPACPYPLQVQRNMRAWLEDDRRYRRHTGTLSHRAFALEPLDTVAWTSRRNGYIDKWFEASFTGTSLYSLLVAPALREVDPDDYDWNPSDELPDPTTPGGWELPEVQAVPGFNVQPWSIKDDDSDDRRPAIRAAWDIDGAIDATALLIEVRVAATLEAVASVTVANIDKAEQVISEGILPATSYEVRAQYLVDRPTEWTVWHGVTTGNILLSEKDFDFDALVEALGPSIVIPQIMKPAKDTIIQAIIDAAKNDIVTRDAATLTAEAFAGVFGNVASIRQEQTTRLTADEAFTQQLNIQISRIDGNAASIATETTTRATADSALAASISALGVTVGSNTAAITAEQIARADADTAIALSVTNLSSTVGTNTAAISAEAVTRANADTAIAGTVTDLTTTVNTNTAAISTEAVTRANADTAIAGTVTAVNARLNNVSGSGVTIEQTFNAQASSITGLQGQYTLRINVNGRVSGFGLASGVGGSEFSILADRFIVVDPANNSTAAYPFQVVGGAVYIRKAFIQAITADQIDVNELSAISATMGDLDIRPTAGQAGRIRIFDETDSLRVVLGRLT